MFPERHMAVQTCGDRPARRIRTTREQWLLVRSGNNGGVNGLAIDRDLAEEALKQQHLREESGKSAV